MTDNRTNEPTEAQLLAGLNALYRAEHEQANIKRPFIDAINLDDWSPQAIARMRAALEAAQGAAPQAAKDIHEPNHDRVYCVRCGGNWPCQPTPVLPSSGVDEDDCWHEANCRCVRAGIVDEDKLAEVIGRDENYTREVELGGWMLDPRLAARAVAEWLKGQGQ